ncbi:MAG: hypothetical protein WDN69_36225 [Aliidongia sp.]
MPESAGANSTADARPFGDPLIQGIQSGAVGDGEREMVQADIGAPVERSSAVGRLDLHKVTKSWPSETNAAG